MGVKIIIYIDHVAIRYLLSKTDTKPRHIIWILLLQEFDINIRDKKKGLKNMVANHLSRLIGKKEDLQLDDYFSDANLFALVQKEMPWYAYYANYIADGILPLVWTTSVKRNSSLTLGIIIGTSLWFLREDSKEFSWGVFNKRKLRVLWFIIMFPPKVDMLVPTKVCQKSCKLVFISPISSKMSTLL